MAKANSLHRLRKPIVSGIFVLFISIFSISVFTITGCSQKVNLQNPSQPLGAYLINYSTANHNLSMQSIDVTPPSSGEDITGKAGLYQAGNAVYNGLAITAPVFVTNNDTDNWTGVVIQAYGLKSGNATVCDSDLGTNWYVDNPENGAWGWIFTSGTTGSEFTIPSGGRSVVSNIGFNASSDFASVVYIYAGAPIIENVAPDGAEAGATVAVTGYNFSTTEGTVTFNGITGTVQSWNDREIIATVPPGGATGNVIVHTEDPSLSCSNPYERPRQTVSIDCSTPGPNPVNAGSSMACTISARGGKPEIDSSADTCGGSIISGGYCGEGWTYSFSPTVGQSGTCTAAVINGSAQALSVITITTCGQINTFPVGNNPNGIAVDAAGNIWVTNSHDNTITKLSSSGVLIGTYPVGGSNPIGIAIDASGNPWITNIYSGTVTKMSPSGSILGTYPAGITIDSSGNVWISNAWGSNYITKLSSSGSMIGTYYPGQFPVGVAIDASNNLWVANTNSNTVAELSPSGAIIGSFPITNSPSVPAIDSTGNIWVPNNTSVVKLSPSGSPIAAYTIDTGEHAMALDSSDNVWITNVNNNSLTELSPDGTVLNTYQVGSQPYAPIIDAKGDVWTVNYGSNSITEIVCAAQGPQYFPFSGPQFPGGGNY